MKAYVCKEDKTIKFNGDKIKVKQYLDYNMKNLFITLIIQSSKDEEGNFNSSPLSQDLAFTFGILKFYTDLDVENDNLVDLYNSVKGSGLFDEIIFNIPEEELFSLQDMIDKSIIIEKERNGVINTISNFLNQIADKIPETNILQDSLNKFSDEMKKSDPLSGFNGKTKLKDLIKR
jgi:hypothetical protein